MIGYKEIFLRNQNRKKFNNLKIFFIKIISTIHQVG